MFECLTLVFDSGISLFDPFGNEQMVHPRLYAYVCDHPEAMQGNKISTNSIAK